MYATDSFQNVCYNFELGEGRKAESSKTILWTKYLKKDVRRGKPVPRDMECHKPGFRIRIRLRKKLGSEGLGLDAVLA